MEGGGAAGSKASARARTSRRGRAMFLTGVRSANALTERVLRRRSAAWVVALVGACAPVAWGATKDWNNASGGDWQDGANWTPTGAPGAGDDANFNLGSAGGYSLTFSSAASANGLTVHTDRPTLLLGGTQAL